MQCIHKKQQRQQKEHFQECKSISRNVKLCKADYSQLSNNICFGSYKNNKNYPFLIL